jgi:hypothetical protein
LIRAHLVAIAQYPVSQREDQRAREHAAHGRQQDLLDGNQRHGNRREQTVLNLQREAQVARQINRRSLKRREERRDGDDARQ